MDLRGKTAVVTGGGRGIGRATALRLAARGAAIALVDRDADGLDATCRHCEAHGVVVREYVANVADEGEVARTMAAIVKDLGSLDVLVNNAGIIRDSLLTRMTLAQWQSVIDVNLTGVFLCGREAAGHMIAAGRGGVIVNISSVSRHGNAGQSNYAAAKAGVAALSVVWSKELARHGIRTGSIAPGFIETDILSAMRPEMLEKMLGPVPLGRAGQADEVAHAAQFIVENDYFTGRCIDLDGGLRL